MSEIPEIPDGPAPDRTAPSAASWRTFAAGAVIVLAGIAAYHNSLDTSFQFDDTLAVIENRTIRRLWPPWEALSPPVAGGAGATGRPLTNLSLAVNYAIDGLEVRGYHVMNLALHLLAALTLWGVLRRTLRLLSGGSGLARDSDPRGQVRSHHGQPVHSTGSGFLQKNAESLAFSTALLWTVHPLLTESVVCVVQRNEVLAGLFYLLTLYCFIRGVEVGRVSDPPSRPVEDRSCLTWWFAVSVAACLLGMASKEIVATAPLLVLLFDRTFVAGTFREAWQRRKLFYGALAATWLLLAWLMWHTRQRDSTVGFGLGVSSWEYLLTQCRALVIYLKLSFWPHPLVADYGTAVVKSAGQVWWQGLLVVALLLAALAALWRKPVLGFLGAWFFVILAPSSSFVPLTTQTIAEHRMYLPLAAVVVLAVAGLHAWLGRRGWLVGAALATGLGWATVQRNKDYRTEFTLWTDTVAKLPANERARNNLGTELLAAGRVDEALAQFEAVLRLKPDYAEAERNLGLALGTAGRYAEAVPHFERAVQLKPDYAEGELSWAIALMNTNRSAEAVPHFERAVRLKPDYVRAHWNLALALTITDSFAKAVPYFEKAIALNPDSAEAHSNYAGALVRAGKLDEAVAQFNETLRVRPDDAGAHLNLALTLRRLGRMEEATRHYREALRLNPGLGRGNQ